MDEYLRSPDFQRKASTTQAEYRRVIEKFAVEHGSRRVADLQRRHILKMRDQLAERPGAANTLVRTLSVLMSFAVEREYRTENPAKGVKQFATGKHEAWQPDEIRAFRERWPIGSMQRRAFSLALFTLQRRGDLCAMTVADIEGDAIRVRQNKTGKPLWIALHAQLKKELEEDPPGHDHLLVSARGRPFSPVYFGAWFAEAIDAAGLPERCVLHGLRDTGAVLLAHAGVTHAQLKAVGGWTSDRMVGHYLAEASQRRLAAAAIDAWAGTNREGV